VCVCACVYVWSRLNNILVLEIISLPPNSCNWDEICYMFMGIFRAAAADDEAFSHHAISEYLCAYTL